MQAVAPAPEPAPRPLPSLPTTPLLGHLPAVRSRGMLPVLLESRARFGDLFGLRFGPYDFVIVSHPDHVEHVLLRQRERYQKGAAYDGFRLMVGDGLITAEGDRWRRKRRLAQPSFTSAQVAAFGPAMVSEAVGVLDRWRTYADGTEIDVLQELSRYAMDVIGRTVLDLGEGDADAWVSQAIADMLGFISARSESLLQLPLWFPTPSNRRFRSDLSRVDAVLAERTRDRDGGKDLMSLLRAARDPETGEKLSDKDLRDEVFTMFLAGFETTARTLTWALQALALAPEVDARVVEELDRVVGAREPAAEDVPRLPYLKQTLCEVLRLWGPVPSVPRDLVEPDQLGPHPLAKGMGALLVFYLTHRHPDFWPDPERFDPERFTPAASKGRHPFSWVPFSTGPRVCVGNHFALQEMALVLATLLPHYRLDHDGRPPVEAKIGSLLDFASPVRLTLRRR